MKRSNSYPMGTAELGSADDQQAMEMEDSEEQDADMVWKKRSVNCGLSTSSQLTKKGLEEYMQGRCDYRDTNGPCMYIGLVREGSRSINICEDHV